MNKGKRWGANTTHLNIAVRADVKKAMEELRDRRCHEAGGYINLGVLFTEAARLLLKREGVLLPADREAELYKAAPKPPSSTGRKRRETAVA